MTKEVLSGTIRICKDLKTYEYSNNKWKISNKEFPEALNVINLFKTHNHFKDLIDQKNPKFLKGQLYQDKVQGARLNILPTGEKLDKAYSILAKNLTIHSENSHDHWDVIYQNPNGKYAYLYTQEKKNKAVRNKYKKVELFEKNYSKIQQSVSKALNDEKDIYALPLYTLLKTYMRVGNEINYKETKHKGLTTLKKQDIKIKDNLVSFNYLAKSGVPMNIEQEFPTSYINRLKEKLNKIKNNEFIFTNNQNKPLKDTDFMKAFQTYCGQSFYPHIVRSFYATTEAKKFLKAHKKAKKEEIKQLFTEIAEKLGHKRFDKKTSEWKDSFTVTIHHYIQPDIVEKIQSLVN
ncbi:hypothetical protein J4423_01690 [Candidatus Pacearchaeota archaeon]|nr:hypothetical protein [Candidatus Pacearchaeota archaeon]